MKKTEEWLHSPCSECGGQLHWQTISQEFEREGLRVMISGIRALVCEKCGEIYFPPGGAQALAEAANGLFALARKSQQHKGKLTADAKHRRAKRGRKVSTTVA
ncbi:MAG: YgiT-type zinc finger protein [Armatimonadota bacterium]|nr:YgiT-type zinc finger protein [Armatimonadota bacterium]